jgi:ribosomal-protein-alanine N-acetyltransferase
MSTSSGSDGMRPMRWWDIESVAAIEREAFGASAWSPEAFWGELARDDRYYVVVDAGGVVAYAGLWAAPPDADIQTIAVGSGRRGCGLGEVLLRHLVDQARERGARRLHLEVRADNAAARRLYSAAGFREVRVRERYYPDSCDAVVMELAL